MTQVSMRRSSLRRFITSNSGGTISGMKAMCIGTRFWLMMLIASSARIISHLMPVPLPLWARAMMRFAIACDRPE